MKRAINFIFVQTKTTLFYFMPIKFLFRPLPDEDFGPVMIPIEIPPPVETSEVRDVFSEISPFDGPGFEQRNQNECKLQNIYEAQKPINSCSHRRSSKIQSGPSMMSQRKPTGSLPQGWLKEFCNRLRDVPTQPWSVSRVARGNFLSMTTLHFGEQ